MSADTNADSSTEIVIAAMVPRDYNAVIALWKACRGILLGDVDDREHITAYLERNPGLSHVARAGRDLIGAVLCGHDGRRGYLYHLAVHPRHRNRGIGGLLAEACLVQLERAGVSRCNIFVAGDDLGGSRFWRQRGWHDWPELLMMSKSTTNEPGGDGADDAPV